MNLKALVSGRMPTNFVAILRASSMPMSPAPAITAWSATREPALRK